ncbi:hypothetical protein B7982_05425 [Fibrobacter sp. UWB2]|jgi:hypothetical protein|uniref:hypothetical protein n=1 Tax=Fibrobacter sp. UWB2 TaxID=1964358 RepID=UPI000B524BA6|nr:hypothetical protein [Fibrobacter sp. UWB2]OWV23871.1 hypothetical protein B7982_05425 [Fibrobacter sp. UWB2]
MKNGEINNTTPIENLREILNGAYSVNTVNDWSVIVVSSNVEFWELWCQKAGSYLLPAKADKTLIAKVFNNDGSVSCQVVKIGQTAICVSQPCKVEIQKLNTKNSM